MKEIMMQYGQSVIAVVVAVLLLLIIGGGAADKAHTVYAKTGQLLDRQNVEAVSDNAEFERYWRLR